MRNETSGHGLGTAQPDVPAYLVRYGLNVTAAAILLLAAGAAIVRPSRLKSLA